MKSRNVWVMAIEVMKITRYIGEVIVRSMGVIARRDTDTRFMWIPGMRPVIVPARRPRRMAIGNCNMD